MSLAKRNIACLFIIVASIALAAPAFAAYTPLVRLPGLPATGNINLSMYLVGLYNFLVSIVGIVAVMMMIVGGMRYITAGGSSTAIGDAKDIVTNAVSGLVIAIFAWVIIAAINPDVLYIRQPGVTFVNTAKTFLNCVSSFTAPNTCICNDGATIISLPLPTTDIECATRCSDELRCIQNNALCVQGGWMNKILDPKFNQAPYKGKCKCSDGTLATPSIPIAAITPPTCDAVCKGQNTDLKDYCGFDYLVVKADVFPATEYGKSPFQPDGTWEMWSFYLTNDGVFDSFNVTAPFRNVLGTDYDCAILATEEDTGLWDNNCVIWVKIGTEIKNTGADIGSQLLAVPGQVPPGGIAPYGACDGGIGPPACGVTLGFGCPGINWGTVNDVINSRFTGKVFDHCSDCSFAVDSNTYRPIYSIYCDPVEKKWILRQ